MTTADMVFIARNVHTVFEGGSWRNIREHALDSGGIRVEVTCSSRAAAITAGRAIARREGVAHVVHDRQGRVLSREAFA